MSAQTQSESKLRTSLVIDRKIWAKIKQISTLSDIDAMDLTELSLRILIAIVEHGSIPDDLGEVLSSRDPEALEQLSKLVKRMRR